MRFAVNVQTGVKVSRNAPERLSGARILSFERSAAAKLFDFTAGTYVPGPSKLGTFTIVIQLISHSNFTFYDHKLNVFTKFYKIAKSNTKIMLNTFSRSFIIWEPAIKTWAQEMNGGPKSWTVPPPWKLYFNPCTLWRLTSSLSACASLHVCMPPPSKNPWRRLTFSGLPSGCRPSV